jgi:hypothetical protein
MGRFEGSKIVLKRTVLCEEIQLTGFRQSTSLDRRREYGWGRMGLHIALTEH